MTAALRAELRKLFTIRSTYVILLLTLAFVCLVAGYAKGYHISGAELTNPHQIADSTIAVMSSLPIILGSIVAILLMTHEYRYNTIMYTLTAANSRSKVLGAKIIAISIFGLLFTLGILVLSPLLTYLGVHLHGHSLVAQSIPYKDVLWRCMFYGWSGILAALLIATLVRNQIGAVVALFVIPTLEQIFGLILKNNAVYLPFTSSGEILNSPVKGSITYAHAAMVFSTYLIIGWVVAWMLFLRRDAN